MMNKIKLTFFKPEYVAALITDSTFTNDRAKQYSPILIDNYNIQFEDTVESHSPIDSELWILKICGEAISQLFFDSKAEVFYLNSETTKMKKGIVIHVSADPKRYPIVIDTQTVQN